jgi:glyoxylase I family protein
VTELARFHHVALTVRDVAASASWYARVLGFQVLFREDGDTRRSCVMRFADGGYAVGLVEYPAMDDVGFDPRRIGLDHVAFLVERREDLDAWADRFDAAGVTHSGAIDAGPGAILNFKDPDGIGLALFWDEPDETD